MVSVEQSQELTPKSSSNEMGDKVAIFTDTNMGTHIAIAVSPHITIFDFQKELEIMHFSCFPKVGEVKASKVMVKRKACFYCLPRSFLIKYAFRCLDKPCFLHVEMSPSSFLEKHIATECDVHISDGHNVGDSVPGNTDMNDMVKTYKKKCLNTMLDNPEEVLIACLEKERKKKKQVNEFLVHEAGDLDKEHQNACERSPGVKPQADTIRKEKKFPSILLSSRSNISESFNSSSAASVGALEIQLEAKTHGNFLEHQICSPPHFAIRTPAKNLHWLQPKYLTHRSSELGMKNKVGKRILSAAYKLRLCRNKQRASSYLFRGSLSASPGITSSVFEISDSDD